MQGIKPGILTCKKKMKTKMQSIELPWCTFVARVPRANAAAALQFKKTGNLPEFLSFTQKKSGSTLRIQKSPIQGEEYPPPAPPPQPPVIWQPFQRVYIMKTQG